ncbi:hypothetical protein ACIREE_15380 [Streptomyces sp. NPDC102467]|uniref:hypothetical protein n=1 Tax=Streptomyces sp. NPDC102467 TaxID=3366179 RepID=UPI0037F27B4B
MATKKAKLRLNYLRGTARDQLLPVQVGDPTVDYWPSLTDEQLARAHDAYAQLPLDGFTEFRSAVVEMRDALAMVEPYADLDWNSESEWLPGPDTFTSLLVQLKRVRDHGGISHRVRSAVRRRRSLP